MGSEGKISYWIANLCGEFDTLCSETKDMLPQEPIEHVRNQFLIAGDSLKQFYLDLTKDVLPIFKWHSPQENGPKSPKQEENTGLPRDNKSTISTDDSQDGILEAVKFVSHMSYAGPLAKIRIGCVPKERMYVFEESSLISMSDSLLRGLTAEEIQKASRAKFAASAQCLAVGSYDDIDESSNICDSEFSTEIQEYKVPDDESSGAMESDAHAKLADDESSDSKFSTELQENKKTDDESSGAIHSSRKDSALFGLELRGALLELGFIDCDSGSVQSLELNYSEETEESDNSTVSECSTEEEYETSASLVSTISTGTSSSDSTIFGNELLDRLLEVDLVVEPSNLDRTLSEDEVRAQLFELGFIEASFDHSDSTMFERELQSGLLELGFLDSDSDSNSDSDSDSDSDPDSDSDSDFDSGSDSASDLDTSDYSSSEETPDCHVTKLGNGVARLSEEQKLDHSIIQETDHVPLSEMKFVKEHSCETTFEDSPDAEATQENAEVSQDKEWERLDEDISDSDWEII